MEMNKHRIETIALAAFLSEIIKVKENLIRQVERNEKTGGRHDVSLLINDLPMSLKLILLKPSKLEEVSVFSGAYLRVEGKYITMEEKKNNDITRDQFLNLLIKGRTKQSILLALMLVEHLVKDVAVNTEIITGQVEKVLVGMEAAPAEFDLRGRLLGPGGGNLQYIVGETEAEVTLRGRGSGFEEPDFGKESPEPLHIRVQHARPEVVQAGRILALHLVETVQQEFTEFCSRQTKLMVASQPAQQLSKDPAQKDISGIAGTRRGESAGKGRGGVVGISRPFSTTAQRSFILHGATERLSPLPPPRPVPVPAPPSSAESANKKHFFQGGHKSEAERLYSNLGKDSIGTSDRKLSSGPQHFGRRQVEWEAEALVAPVSPQRSIVSLSDDSWSPTGHNAHIDDEFEDTDIWLEWQDSPSDQSEDDENGAQYDREDLQSSCKRLKSEENNTTTKDKKDGSKTSNLNDKGRFPPKRKSRQRGGKRWRVCKISKRITQYTRALEKLQDQNLMAGERKELLDILDSLKPKLDSWPYMKEYGEEDLKTQYEKMCVERCAKIAKSRLEREKKKLLKKEQEEELRRKYPETSPEKINKPKGPLLPTPNMPYSSYVTPTMCHFPSTNRPPWQPSTFPSQPRPPPVMGPPRHSRPTDPPGGANLQRPPSGGQSIGPYAPTGPGPSPNQPHTPTGPPLSVPLHAPVGSVPPPNHPRWPSVPGGDDSGGAEPRQYFNQGNRQGSKGPSGMSFPRQSPPHFQRPVWYPSRDQNAASWENPSEIRHGAPRPPYPIFRHNSPNFQRMPQSNNFGPPRNAW